MSSAFAWEQGADSPQGNDSDGSAARSLLSQLRVAAADVHGRVSTCVRLDLPFVELVRGFERTESALLVMCPLRLVLNQTAQHLNHSRCRHRLKTTLH